MPLDASLNTNSNTEDFPALRAAEQQLLAQMRQRIAALQDEIKDENLGPAATHPKWRKPSGNQANGSDYWENPEYWRTQYAARDLEIQHRQDALQNPIPADHTSGGLAFLTRCEDHINDLFSHPGLKGWGGSSLKDLPQVSKDGFSASLTSAHDDLTGIISQGRQHLADAIAFDAQKIEQETLQRLQHKISAFPPSSAVSTDVAREYLNTMHTTAQTQLAQRQQAISGQGASYDVAQGAGFLDNITDGFTHIKNITTAFKASPAHQNVAADQQAADQILATNEQMLVYVEQQRKKLHALRDALTAAVPTAQQQQQQNQPPQNQQQQNQILPGQQQNLPPGNAQQQFGPAAHWATTRTGSFLIGMGTSTVIKAAFTIAGAAILGAAAAIPLAIAGGALAAVAAHHVKTHLTGTSPATGTWKRAALFGALGGVFGAVAGHFIGEYLSPYFHATGTPTTGAPVSSLTQAQNLLHNLPQGTTLPSQLQNLVNQATSSNASALDVMKACKEVSFFEINSVGGGATQNGYALVKAGWNVATDNSLAGNPWGKMLGLDYGYAQDIAAPGIPGNSSAAIDLAKNIGSIAQNPWMSANPWRAGLAANGLVP